VPDDDDVRGPDVARCRERPQHVLGDDRTGVAQHVSVAELEAEEIERVDARVHAREDRDALGGRRGHAAGE